MLKSLFPGWVFIAMDASGHSGGLAIGYKESRVKIINHWGLKNVLGMEVLSPDFPFSITIVNVYGPCQSRELFWEELMSKTVMNSPLMIMGGDLNFSLGRTEAWGPFAREDPLVEFFHNLISENNLIDPASVKLKPTWRNRRVGDDRIAKRLDRFLVSKTLFSKVPMIRQWVEELGNSDHFPIFLDLTNPPSKPPAPFKFNPAWLQDPTFCKLFNDTWIHQGQNTGVDKSFLFMENLKRLKKATIFWAKDKKLKQNEEMSRIREEMKQMESMEIDGYSSQASKDRILLLEKQQNKILMEKEEEWRIKSRAIWLKAGDENTRFFHNYAKGRKSKNTIWRLKDEEGREVGSFPELSGLGKRHFQNIFADQGEATIAEVFRTVQSFPRFVEEDEAEDLTIPVTKEEIEAAMKLMEITDVVEDSRQKGVIYRPFNSRFIALIPKKDDPESFEDFRPISLCNCIYKIISKVIALRIAPILSRNISMEQFGFLDGRQIHEAIGVAQEVTHSIKTKKKKGVVLKIDLSKAYDRISWLYLRMLLTHIGFSYPFVSWIMGCITNVSFAVLVNGAASSFFNSQRSLRQGCPLSPLLFLLVAEGLSRLIHKARREEKVKGIEVAINLYITHLLFVDDILIFTNGSHNELKEFKCIFDLFLKATDPFKYLGFWLKPAVYKKVDWNWLIAKIESRISHWSFRWLSRAGRLTLIKSVLSAIPVYWAALTWIPKGVMEKIRRICCRFLWTGSKESLGLPWVAWDKVGRPKEWGGWGIKRSPDFNISLAAKSGWRLISMENLWTRVVKRKYIDPIPMDEWIRSQNKKTKNSSAIWKATVEAFSVIEQGLAWKVGDGKQIRIGRDPWVGCNEAFALSPGLLRHLDTKGILTLNQVERVGQSTIWGQAWKDDEALGLNARWKNEWEGFIKELQRTNVRIKDEPDCLMWAQSKSGEYSPKDGYSFLMGKKGWGCPEWWAKEIWKLKCPTKARLFFWCIMKRKVPTWDTLQARFLAGPGCCPLCKSDEESINHLFNACAFARKIWEEVMLLLKIKAQWGPDPLEVSWKKWWQSYPEGNMRNLPLIFAWGVWLTRNKSLFQDKDVPPSITATNITTIYTALPPPEDKVPKSKQNTLILQEGIPCGYFDGASQDNKAGAGMCIHINSEHSLKASVGLGSGTNNYAELSALRLLLCWLHHRNINTIQIFGDSLNVVNWVNGTATCQNQILKTIVDEILSLKTFFNRFSLCHIYRDRNEEADQLSKAGLQQDLGYWTVEEIRQGQSYRTDQPPYSQPS
eukprot:PITA_29408